MTIGTPSNKPLKRHNFCSGFAAVYKWDHLCSVLHSACIIYVTPANMHLYKTLLSITAVIFLAILRLTSLTCSPFVYTRNAVCSEKLAANDYSPCGTMDLGEERGFCEIQSADDLIAIESVARVMIEETVSLWNEQNSQCPLLLTWFNFNPSMDK